MKIINIDVELLYTSRFNYYCFLLLSRYYFKHYHELKEQNDEINDISFDSSFK